MAQAKEKDFTPEQRASFWGYVNTYVSARLLQKEEQDTKEINGVSTKKTKTDVNVDDEDSEEIGNFERRGSSGSDITIYEDEVLYEDNEDNIISSDRGIGEHQDVQVISSDDTRNEKQVDGGKDSTAKPGGDIHEKKEMRVINNAQSDITIYEDEGLDEDMKGSIISSDKGISEHQDAQVINIAQSDITIYEEEECTDGGENGKTKDSSITKPTGGSASVKEMEEISDDNAAKGKSTYEVMEDVIVSSDVAMSEQQDVQIINFDTTANEKEVDGGGKDSIDIGNGDTEKGIEVYVQDVSKRNNKIAQELISIEADASDSKPAPDREKKRTKFC